MKKLNKIIFAIFVLVLMLMIPNIVLGASASISAGSRTITKGNSTNISVSIAATETWNLKISSSGGSLSGSTYSTDASDGETSRQVISATFTANTPGTYTIYLTGQIAGSDLQKLNVSKQVIVTVTEPTSNSGGSSSGGSSYNSSGNTSKPNNTTTTPKEVEKSKDSTLSALSVTEGTIAPEFNKDVREYSLNIPYEISAINVVATPTDSKAKVEVIGNTELKEGENTVTVTITAEDGSTSKYLIRVTRARVPLALKSLIVKYTNENGELIETTLNPVFAFDTLEYTLEDLEYWVNNLSIEAIANIEGATVDIQGADSLNTGENTITITLNIKETENIPEGEEPKEETITYTIKVIKKEEPTVLAKISNWFKDIFGGVASWYNNNQEKVIVGALGVCIVALIGLSVYIIVDHNRYKDVIAKAKMERKANKLNTNNVSENIIEEIHKETNDTKKDVVENDKNDKTKNGKHF